jgi:capsular exopolysaccharide synthesis family protein
MPGSIKLITLQEPSSSISEAYRTLRMNLQYATLDRSLRSLLITSPGPDEGKSTTLANLAVTLAQVDRRVIMVDCDLRRPHLHEIFELENKVGLTTMMLDDEMLEHPPLLQTPVDNLWLLPSGQLPPRPADLLGSQRMDTVIERLLTQCDMLLFDASPVVGVTDAVVLATKVDAVLLVVCAGETKREQAQSAIERLKTVNAHIVGSVLNNAPITASLSSYYQ